MRCHERDGVGLLGADQAGQHDAAASSTLRQGSGPQGPSPSGREPLPRRPGSRHRAGRRWPGPGRWFIRGKRGAGAAVAHAGHQFTRAGAGRPGLHGHRRAVRGRPTGAIRADSRHPPRLLGPVHARSRQRLRQRSGPYLAGHRRSELTRDGAVRVSRPLASSPWTATSKRHGHTCHGLDIAAVTASRTSRRLVLLLSLIQAFAAKPRVFPAGRRSTAYAIGQPPGGAG